MEIFLNWKAYNLNMLPEDIKKEYNEKIIPAFGFDKEAHFLKSFFKILEEKLFNQPLLFKTESYNYFQGDKLNHSNHRKAYYSQIERYIQGYKEGLKLRSSLNGEKLFRQLKINFNELDYSEYFKYNGDDSVLLLVDENTPQEFYSFPIDLYEYGKKTGYFVNCWELLLKEYYPVILHNSVSLTKKNIFNTEPDNKNISFKEILKHPNKEYEYFEALREAIPNLLSENHNYIGKNKGYFPLFINCLKDLELIYNHSDIVYKNALNSKVKNLKLSKDASEFRTDYKRVTESNKTDLKLLLSLIPH